MPGHDGGVMAVNFPQIFIFTSTPPPSLHPTVFTPMSTAVAKRVSQRLASHTPPSSPVKPKPKPRQKRTSAASSKATITKNTNKKKAEASRVVAQKDKKIRKTRIELPEENTEDEAMELTEDEGPAVVDDVDLVSTVRWGGLDSTRVEALLSFLDERPDVRIKLFSDSTEAAREEGRSKRVAKSPKMVMYRLVAAGVFSIDEDENYRLAYAADKTDKYAKACENVVGRCAVFYSKSCFFCDL